MENTKKIDWVSKSKGFAILGVLAVHTAQKFNINQIVSNIAFSGQYCVQLFFIISAYLIYRSLENSNFKLNKINYFRFVGHKITRFIPVLYTCAIWHFIIQCIVEKRFPDIHAVVWRDGFFCVTFLNGFSKRYINPWMCWYIGDLAIFIVLVPFLYQLVNNKRKSFLFIMVSLIISWLADYIPKRSGVYDGWFYYFYFPVQLPLLAIGIFFYYCEKSLKETNNNIKELISTILYIACFISFRLLLIKSSKIDIVLNHVQYGILYFIFTYVIFNKSTHFKLFKVLGDYCYGIYLYHGCIIAMMDIFVTKMKIEHNSNLNFTLYYIVLLGLSFGCSVLANKYLEKPFFKLMKNKFDI